MTETVRRRKTPKPPLEIELRLRNWGGRGSTVAETGERTINVDRGIPGEQVLALVDRRRRPWRGVVEQVLEPSEDRIAPPCRYYLAGCGGCQWQHLRYEAQVETKRMLADRELEKAGLEIRVSRVTSMEEPWRYRHTAAIAIGWEAGFRPRGRRGILEIHDCPISHPLIGLLSDRLNHLLRAGALPNYHGKVWLDCTVIGSSASPGLQVLIQSITGLTLETHPELPEIAQTIASIDEVRSVAYRHRSGEPRPLVGDLLTTIDVAGRDMYLPSGSFFQTNLTMVPHVLERMREVLADRSVRTAADVYGGVGTFGLHLASSLDRMTLVELDPVAVDAARRTAAAWGLENVDFVSRHAEQALPELDALDLVIVDPPRSGLGTAVTTALIGNSVPLVLYVSCSPLSLARDLAELQAGGYHISSLELFDFYPQTYHVEGLAVLER